MPLLPNQILNNRYQILALLGQGGMGAVYRAFDQVLQRAVAIKEHIPDPNATPQGLAQARAQFQREARVLANLHHDNLPRVTDYFSFGGNEYLVMDLIEGMGLDQVVQQHGAISEGAVRAWMNQVLDALIYIHSQNPPVIHRDIKPANLILKPDGKVTLVDFGLVKLLDPNNPRTLSAMRAMGTPEYAPIEQFSPGMHTDARSDLYSLGATMYHLLSGHAPLDVPHRLVDPTQMPNLRAINPNISPQMEWVVHKALEIQPQNRFQSAKEIRQALTTPLPFPSPQRGGAIPQPGGVGVPPSPPGGGAGGGVGPARDKLLLLYSDARAAQNAGDLQKARTLFRQFVAQASDPKDAPLRLQKLELYLDADALMQQALKDPDDQPDHWIQAADKLAQLLQLDANFMDAAAKWQTTQRWLALPDLYNRLQDAFERDDWTNVLALWQHIASVKPKYRFTQDLFARAWPEIVRAGVTRRVSQPDGKEMLLVPAGEFTMGSNAYDAEKPIHTVYLDTFYLDRYPVTNAEYKKFVDATRRAAPQHWQGGRIPSGFENHPVVFVSWNDAVAYAQWAGKRLPTEAEWEKAASWDFVFAVSSAPMPWGDTFDASKCNSQGIRYWDHNAGWQVFAAR
jgi:formylglycine-generating enzyme required for sulfatase activity/tRNA A-37 threonylcarbamoyl transferase component Bud32